jgi:hypothetical protein
MGTHFARMLQIEARFGTLRRPMEVLRVGCFDLERGHRDEGHRWTGSR